MQLLLLPPLLHLLNKLKRIQNTLWNKRVEKSTRSENPIFIQQQIKRTVCFVGWVLLVVVVVVVLLLFLFVLCVILGEIGFKIS